MNAQQLNMLNTSAAEARNSTQATAAPRVAQFRDTSRIHYRTRPTAATPTPTTPTRRRRRNQATSTPRAERPRMTADQATHFDRVSVANAALARMERSACECQPYVDMFTYGRWAAQGMQVQRGERAIKLPLVKFVDQVDPETGDTTTERRIFGTSRVFCRCQVQPRSE